MYLHLGQAVIVPTKNIVGIFDLDITSQSKRTRAFLSGEEKKGNIVNVSEELPKSFIVCEEKKKTKTYISQLSSATLIRRTELNISE